MTREGGAARGWRLQTGRRRTAGTLLVIGGGLDHTETSSTLVLPQTLDAQFETSPPAPR